MLTYSVSHFLSGWAKQRSNCYLATKLVSAKKKVKVRNGPQVDQLLKRRFGFPLQVGNHLVETQCSQAQLAPAFFAGADGSVEGHVR